jgi:dTDP-4-dehydrorhamnose reductase
VAGTRRILLFGGAGQVGRELQALSWPDGFVLAAPPRAEADITDRAAVAVLLAAGRWSAVINAAGWTAVDAAEAAEAEAFAANATGPAILAGETARRGIPLIHISTDYVFDGLKPAPYAEADPVRPLGVYGASKLAGEAAVQAGNPRHVILRTAWLFGRFGKNFVKTMLTLAETRDTIRVVDDQHGTPTATADLAAAIAAIATRPDLGDRAGVYHFANRGETTWCGLARRTFALSAELGGPSAAVEAIATADFPTAARRPPNSRLATGKIERDFGIFPRPWEDALAEVVAALVAAARTAR